VSAPTPTPSNEAPQAPATPAAPTAPAGLTAEQVAAIVQSTVRAEVERAQSASAEQAKQIVASQQQQRPADPSAEEAAKTAKVRAFAADPDTFLDNELSSRIDKRLEERVAPGLAPIVFQTRDNLVANQAAKVDAQFGPGFFDKNIRPQLFADGKGAIDRHPPMTQSNANFVEAAIQGVLGAELAKNPEALVSAYNDRKTAERAAQEAPTTWQPGSFNPTDPTSRIHPDIQAGLGRMRELGVEFTEADFRMSKSAGKTLEGWLAASEASKRKGNQ
jgi:hypothetical protein